MSNNCHFHPWDVRSFNTTCIDWCEHHNGKKHARALKQQMCEKLQLWLHLEIDTQDPLPAVLRRCNTRSERVNQIISIATSLNGSVCTFNDDSITNRYISVSKMLREIIKSAFVSTPFYPLLYSMNDDNYFDLKSLRQFENDWRQPYVRIYEWMTMPRHASLCSTFFWSENQRGDAYSTAELYSVVVSVTCRRKFD